MWSEEVIAVTGAAPSGQGLPAGGYTGGGLPGPTAGGEGGGGGGGETDTEAEPHGSTLIDTQRESCLHHNGTWDTYKRRGRRYYECLLMHVPEAGKYTIEYYNAQGEGIGHCVGTMQGPVSEQCTWLAVPHP